MRRQLDDVAQFSVLDDAVAAVKVGIGVDADADADAVIWDVDESGRISQNTKI